ncbi:MAG: hypothetical protein K8L97_32740 [Anaerolineae bacterium]|nr:hypothetical protein [Anaerolineae bacterium]
MAAIAIAKMGLRAKGGIVVGVVVVIGQIWATKVLRRFGIGLPLQYLLNSYQLRVSSFQKIQGKWRRRRRGDEKDLAATQPLALRE